MNIVNLVIGLVCWLGFIPVLANYQFPPNKFLRIGTYIFLLIAGFILVGSGIAQEKLFSRIEQCSNEQLLQSYTLEQIRSNLEHHSRQSLDKQDPDYQDREGLCERIVTAS